MFEGRKTFSSYNKEFFFPDIKDKSQIVLILTQFQTMFSVSLFNTLFIVVNSDLLEQQIN